MTQTRLLTSILLGCSGQALLSGCSTNGQALEIRPVGKAPAALSPGAAGIAQAYAMLRLGNAGTALEAFRKIQRDTPSAEALAGIAECYVAMGRDDVAKAKYEEALALAPSDPRLLRAVAQVMDRMGMRAEAALARGQADALSPVGAAPATLASSAPVVTRPESRATAPVVAAPAPRSPAPVVTLAAPAFVKPAATTAPAVAQAVAPVAKAAAAPAPRPVPAAVATIAVSTAAKVVPPAAKPVQAPAGRTLAAAVAPTPAPVRATPPLPAPAPTTVTSPPPVTEPVVSAPPAQPLALAVAEGSSITVKLPAPRPVETRIASAAPARPAPAAATPAASAGPRLERLSPSVVALVTSSKPLWEPSALARAASAVAVNWQPLRAAATAAVWKPLRTASREVNIQILNAARVQGLARAARSVLLDRGWRKIEVADHGRRQTKSIVYYPADRRKLGKSLAAQFGIRSREVSGGVLTVVLGSDMNGRLGR